MSIKIYALYYQTNISNSVLEDAPESVLSTLFWFSSIGGLHRFREFKLCMPQMFNGLYLYMINPLASDLTYINLMGFSSYLSISRSIEIQYDFLYS